MADQQAESKKQTWKLSLRCGPSLETFKGAQNTFSSSAKNEHNTKRNFSRLCRSCFGCTIAVPS
eukprot:2396718-Amphidinium_carterae.1